MVCRLMTEKHKKCPCSLKTSLNNFNSQIAWTCDQWWSGPLPAWQVIPYFGFLLESWEASVTTETWVPDLEILMNLGWKLDNSVCTAHGENGWRPLWKRKPRGMNQLAQIDTIGQWQSWGETKASLGVGLEVCLAIHLSHCGPCVKFFGYYIKNLFLGNSVELFSPGTPSTLLDSLLCPKLLVLGGDSWDLGAGTEGVGLAPSLGVSQETKIQPRRCCRLQPQRPAPPWGGMFSEKNRKGSSWVCPVLANYAWSWSHFLNILGDNASFSSQSLC